MSNGAFKPAPEVIARANEVLERLFALDEAVINARAPSRASRSGSLNRKRPACRG